MKNGSRGNYKILYRDLDPQQLYNHFEIVDSQQELLRELELEPKKALKAVREMARVHFTEIEPDGYVDAKKAWFGYRWQTLYHQWGDYLSERDQPTKISQAPLRAASRQTSDQSKQKSSIHHSWIHHLGPFARRALHVGGNGFYFFYRIYV